MAGVDVVVDGLRQASKSWEQRSQDAEEISVRARAAELPRGAFGWIPFIGERVHAAHEGLLEDCLTSLDEVGRTLGAVGDAIGMTAEAYAAADEISGGEARAVDALLPEAGTP